MRISFIHNTKHAWHGEGEVFSDLASVDGTYRVTFRVQPNVNAEDGFYKATLTVPVDPTEWFFQVNRWMGEHNGFTIEQRNGGIRILDQRFNIATIDANGKTRIGSRLVADSMVQT